MRTPRMVAVGILVMATAATATPESQMMFHVNGTLVYATASPCTALPATFGASPHQLTSMFMPHDHFTGILELKHKQREQEGCELALRVDGELQVASPANAKHPMEVMKSLDTKLSEAVAANLRGAAPLQKLELEHIHVKVKNRSYALDMQSSQSKESSTSSSVMELHGPCDEALSPTDVLGHLLPSSVVGSEMHVLPVASDNSKCAVGLNIVGEAPMFASRDDAFSLLKAMDANFDRLFDASMGLEPMSLLQDAHVHLKSTPQPTAHAISMATTGEQPPPPVFNGPTKHITLMILGGIGVLCMMLMYVNYKRKAVERRCQERYEKANRAAQIRRVSIRMGYDRLTQRDVTMEHEEDEEKDNL